MQIQEYMTFDKKRQQKNKEGQRVCTSNLLWRNPVM